MKVPAIGRLAYRLVLSGAHLMRMIEAGSTPAPSTSNLKYSNLMRKSEERLKIEALKPGKKVEFPASENLPSGDSRQYNSKGKRVCKA